MPAAKVNFVIEQYATWRKRLVYRNRLKKPMDLTGFGAHMQIRATPGGGLIADLSTANGKIQLNAVPGGIDILITDEETGAMSFTTAAYDLKLLAPNGDEPRLIEGKITFSPGQTRDV